MTVLQPSREQISGVALDSLITGSGTTALKILYDLLSNTIFENLSSFLICPLTAGIAYFRG